MRSPAWWAGWTVAQWAISEITVEQTPKGWETRTSCRATPDGSSWGVRETAEEAAKLAQWIGQFDSDEYARLTGECRQHGRATTPGCGAGRTVTMARGVEFSGDGSISLTECGRAVAQAQSVQTAALIGVERGYWDKSEVPAAIQEIENARAQRTPDETSSRLSIAEQPPSDLPQSGKTLTEGARAIAGSAIRAADRLLENKQELGAPSNMICEAEYARRSVEQSKQEPTRHGSHTKRDQRDR